MKSYKKRAFSLLELVVAFSLIALVSGLLGIKVVGLIEEHRFHHRIELLRQDFIQMKLLSLAHGTDCYIEIFQKDGAFYYQCQSDLNLPGHPVFSMKSLSGVHTLTLDKKPLTRASFKVISSCIEPSVFIGFHRDSHLKPLGSIWFDTRDLLLPLLSSQPSSPKSVASYISQKELDLLFDK